MSGVHQSLKLALASLQILGFCSLKNSTYKERHGCWYYFWSILLLTFTWLNVLREGFPVTWKVLYVSMTLITSFMMINGLWNEKRLVEILENIERLDLKIGPLKRGIHGSATVWVVCIMYQAFKVYMWVIADTPFGFWFAYIAVSVPHIMIVLLSTALYEELALRFSALVPLLLSFCVRDKDFCLSLESVRLLHFSLRNQVCLLNSYLGFPLLCSVFNSQINIFNKFLSILAKYFGANLRLFPDELLIIFYLSSKADFLEHQSRKIDTVLKHLPLYQMDTKTKLQVELFVQQLEACPVKVTANGLFTVDRTLFLSMTVTTSVVYFTTFYLMKNEIFAISVAFASWIQEWLPV